MNASVRVYVRKQVPGIADKVLAQVRPCISAESRQQRDADIPVGHSKLGGRPDVPQGFEWPVADGVPCWFIAQANLAELRAPVDLKLPRRGLMSFFYRDDGGPPGKGSRVYFFREKKLHRIEVVRDTRYEGIHENHLYPRVLTLSPGFSLPRDISRYGFTRVEKAVAEDPDDERGLAVIGREREGYETFDYFWEMFHKQYAPGFHRFFGVPPHQTPPRGHQLLASFGQMNDRLNFYAPPAEAEALTFSGLEVTYECT